jgi:hypothetical protein
MPVLEAARRSACPRESGRNRVVPIQSVNRGPLIPSGLVARFLAGGQTVSLRPSIQGPHSRSRPSSLPSEMTGAESIQSGFQEARLPTEDSGGTCPELTWDAVE